ncbi:MAG: dihydrofolate reductase family protein [Sphingomonadales bacterium]|nr:dihydrofolate reductase family protein [Sphingomonadales bacterium]MDE2569074.1 dihydrofolate reductase family protein [Sphingomonadales bacterium]
MARRIVCTLFQSLDGVMQAPGGPTEDTTGGFAHGGWQMGYGDAVTEAAIGEALAPPFALLLGRRTYDIFASYWPYVEGEAAALGAMFTQAEKYVLTGGDAPLEWENSHRLAGIAAVAALRAGEGPDLRVWGSGTLHPQLLKAGLLDRLTVLTFPILVGKGKRTFREGTPFGGLALSEGQVSPGGVVIATYSPGAPVPAGANFPAPPNAREQERQRRMKEGTW